MKLLKLLKEKMPSFKVGVACISYIFLFSLILSCTAGRDIDSGGGGTVSESARDLINTNNQFALEFYSYLKSTEGESNIFFSPYSIFVALGMTYEGAHSQTAHEIQSVFHFPIDNQVRRRAMMNIHNYLNKNQKAYTLSTANALWVQNDYPLLKEVTDVVSQYYDGRLTHLDFKGAVEESRNTINDWIAHQTQGKIKEAIPQGALAPLTRLVLTNAIYFKGSWKMAFSDDATKEEDFFVGANQTVKVPMMQKQGHLFSYTEMENVQILEMPYKGENISMLVLLPKTGELFTLEERLNINQLNQWKDQLREQKVDVYMPRFSFTSGYKLKEQLKNMGMPLAFNPPDEEGGADFSGFVGKKDLYIAFIKHLAFIDVNEEGTEAAAATTVAVSTTSLPVAPPVFRADRPFVFLIQEKSTGHILFMGKVINPTL